MSIYVEIGLKTVEKRDIEKELYNIIDGLTEMGIVDGHNVVSFEPIIMNPAYVHITKESIEDVKNKMSTLNSLGIYSIGRYGEWTYCSIEDNIISAKNLVNDIG